MEQMLGQFFDYFGMPSVGLPAVFISAFISATLLPVGSEPILFGYVSVNPHLYWVAINVATIGNTLGGMFDWWLELLSRNSFESLKGPSNNRMQRWLEERGPKMLLLSWLPGFGDPVFGRWLAQIALATLFSLYVYRKATALSHDDLAPNFGTYKRLASFGPLAASDLISSVISYVFIVNFSRGHSCLN